MKNIDHVIKMTALKTGLPEDECRKVIMAQWNYVANYITGQKGLTVFIRHIGNFTISRPKLYIQIKKRIKSIRNKMFNRVNATEEMQAKMLVQDRERLKLNLTRRNELAKHYATVFNNHGGYEKSGKSRRRVSGIR